jgi:hypothetical protein
MATGRVPTTANSPLTAKGDLFTYSTAPARLAVGLDGEQIVADSSTSTGLRYQPNFAAGKNVIINGDFSVWQRSTSATVTSENYFAPDRYRSVYVAGGATVTWSRQTFTPGAAPVAGYEGQYFSRMSATSGSGTTVIGLAQRIENVQTFAGQTVTFSFWAKADSARTATILLFQDFGSGGSSVTSPLNTTQAITTSWTRYSFTFSMPSISGKTIGTNSFVIPYLYLNTGQASGTPQLDTWGWQVEASNTATAFQTATGTIQGELAACQRYYYLAAEGANKNLCNAGAFSATVVTGFVSFPVTMRTTPTLDATSGTDYYEFEVASADLFNSLTIYRPSTNGATVVNSTNFSGTIGYAGQINLKNAASKVAFAAEL